MHPERPCGSGDIAAVLDQNFLQMLPFQAPDGERLFLDFDGDVALILVEGRDDLVGIGRLGEILNRTQLYGFDGRGDAGVPSQNDDTGVGVEIVEPLDQNQPGIVADPQIDHSVLGLDLFRQRGAGLKVLSGVHLESALLEGLLQNSTERRVVIDQ